VNEIDLFIPGIPKPAGSKRGFYNPKLKRVIITDDNRKSKDWITVVAQVAAEHHDGQPVLEGPLAARFDFFFPRPKGHYGSGRNSSVLKPSAPPFPDVKPDATKILRATEDALKGILWRDDAQVVTQMVTKRYGPQSGCRIRVRSENA
jgi:Holliday junction resolvase RusA-like endonuclease